MTVAAGQKLAGYEIIDTIGAGGMGEVYHARDCRLGREVAIKILPEHLSRDESRLIRFEREACLLASINHPGIATLYGFEESDGVRFLVMELVKGETLSARIARGSVPVAEALPLFRQIAEALEAAHDQGIVHRDLKPANIKITPEGRAKILDFGLAKALTKEKPVAGASQAPTIAGEATAIGIILGTAPYMSPEQARGKDLDTKTDIWAFGCCLYESLSGHAAFQGETLSDTIALVLQGEPQWEDLPHDTPASIHRLLKRCLQKDHRQRLQSIGDARIEIEDALAGGSSR